MTKKDSAPIILSVLALIVSIVAAAATWTGVVSALNHNAAETRAKNQLDWQTTIIYSIIEEESRKNPKGATIKDIEDKYVARAQAAEGIDLDKRKLQPLEVKRVIIDLLAMKLIWQTGEDNYMTVRTAFVTGGEISVNVTKAMTFAQLFVDKQPGEYTTSALVQKVAGETKVSEAEANYAVNEIIEHTAIRDKDGKLWSQAHPPPPDKLPK